MNKATSYAFVAFLLVVAFVLGWYFPSIMKGQEARQKVEQRLSQYPNLDFNSCLNGPNFQVDACLDGVILRQAFDNNDAGLCFAIQDLNSRENCSRRIHFLTSLGEGTEKFCADMIDDPVCSDFGSILLAISERSRPRCASVNDGFLKEYCFSVLGGVAEPPIPTAQQDGQIAPQYGLLCVSGDEYCQNALPAFKTAVLTQDQQACSVLGLYTEQCLDEIALYSAYLANNRALCSQRLGTVCDLKYTISKALDGNPTLCEALNEPIFQEACKIELEVGFGKVTRFGYLQN